MDRKKKRIKVFVMDVDDTMTDGKIHMGAGGEVFKSFDIKDGYGIHEMLPAHKVKTVIMTGRESRIVLNRGRELEIDSVCQGVKDKRKGIQDVAKAFGCSLEEVAYIGDDVIDIGAMSLCGIKGCPKDAVEEVKEICDFISAKRGGEGAVRDFIEWLIWEGMVGEEGKP